MHIADARLSKTLAESGITNDERTRRATGSCNTTIHETQLFSRMPGIFCIRDNFNLFQFLSSRMSARELTKMAKTLYTLECGYAISLWRERRRSHAPHIDASELHEYSLSSTPLVEGLLAMVDIIPLFQKTYKLHKTNLMVLTDGDANTGWDSVMRYNETGLH